MNSQRVRFFAILTALIFGLQMVRIAPASAQTIPITDGTQTGTQTTTTAIDANGNTVTTVTRDLSGPLNNGNPANNAQPGATSQTNHDVTTTTTDPNGHELDRTDSHVHENLDKNGNPIGRTTRTSTDHTDWKKGVRKHTSKTVTEDPRTGDKTVDDFTTEDTFFGAGPTGKWEQTDGHQTVTEEKKGSPPKKTIDRKFEWPDGIWKSTLSLLQPAVPQAGSGAGTEQVFAPNVSGPGSEIVATVIDSTQNSDQSGPTDQVTVQFDDKKGGHHFFRAFTDPNGHVSFKLPAYAAAFELFTHFTADHKAGPGAARCLVDANATVPGTQAVANVPSTGEAITRASSAYERGTNNLVDLQTRGTDPLRAQIKLNGSAANVQTVSASNKETKGLISQDAPLGRTSVTVGNSNAIPADIVQLRADPIGVSETGAVQTVTVHCDGLPASDPGTMYFQVGGAAVLADGGTTTSVPVQDGIAQVRIRGVHSGAALVRFKLHAQIAGFWT